LRIYHVKKTQKMMYELDKNNIEFYFAAEHVKHTSGNVLFLTGKAGSGKTTFVHHIAEQKKGKIIVLAPTALAAVNAGGQTIHSFFQIAPGIYMPDDKRLRRHAPDGDPDRSTIYHHFKYRQAKIDTIKALETIVLDEASMLRCDLLDLMDTLLRTVRGRHNDGTLYDQPFGGVQVILVGDPFQLPPIAPRDDWIGTY
jgi:Cdc6-like AAA superfamily ATPase